MAAGERQKFFEAFGPEDAMKPSARAKENRRRPNEIFEPCLDFMPRDGAFGFWRTTPLAFAIEGWVGNDVIESAFPGRSAKTANIQQFKPNTASKGPGVAQCISSRSFDQMGLDFEPDDLNGHSGGKRQSQCADTRPQFGDGLAGLDLDGVGEQADLVAGPTAALVGRKFNLQRHQGHSVPL